MKAENALHRSVLFFVIFLVSCEWILSQDNPFEKATQESFVGYFVSDKVKLNILGQEKDYAGEIEFEGKVYEFIAILENGILQGYFKQIDKSWPFTLARVGNTFEFKTGTFTTNLSRKNLPSWIGRWTSSQVKLEIKKREQGYHGRILFQGKTYFFSGSVENGILSGNFSVVPGDKAIAFTVKKDKDGLRFFCGGFQEKLALGILKDASGDKYTYLGESEDGKPHGEGTATYLKGDSYVGQYKEGNMHGKGTYIWANGDKYIGEWKDDKKHGKGTYIWANGGKSTQEWKYDKKHGIETTIYSDGDENIQEWKDGKKYGLETNIYSDGRKSTQEWKDDKKHGIQTIIYTDSNVKQITQEWKDDKKYGMKITIFIDGTNHIQEWKNDEKNGLETYIFAEGGSIATEWKDNRKHGTETIIRSDGQKIIQEWKNGEKYGEERWIKESTEKLKNEKEIQKKEKISQNREEIKKEESPYKYITAENAKVYKRDKNHYDTEWIKVPGGNDIIEVQFRVFNYEYTNKTFQQAMTFRNISKTTYQIMVEISYINKDNKSITRTLGGEWIAAEKEVFFNSLFAPIGKKFVKCRIVSIK